MKYRANVGGGIVEAQKIKDYRFDAKAQQQYLILGDDTRRPQPVLHGMKPMIGDWYVETSTGTTRLRDGSQYEERSAAAIIKAVDFALVYTPVPESGANEPTFKEKVGDVTTDGEIEWTNFGKATEKESVSDPYSEFAADLANYSITPSDDRVNTMPAVLGAPYDLSKPSLDPAEIEEMLKQSLPKIAQDIAAQDLSDNDIREAEARDGRTYAEQEEIEMVDNQTADGE